MAERLHAVMQEKFQPDVLKFDAETPVDKALAFLQSYIKVGRVCLATTTYTLSLGLLHTQKLCYCFKLVSAGLRCSAKKLLCPPQIASSASHPVLTTRCVVLADKAVWLASCTYLLIQPSWLAIGNVCLIYLTNLPHSLYRTLSKRGKAPLFP